MTGLGGEAFTVTSVAWPIFTARVTTTFVSSVAPHALMNGPWTSGAPSWALERGAVCRRTGAPASLWSALESGVLGSAGESPRDDKSGLTDAVTAIHARFSDGTSSVAATATPASAAKTTIAATVNGPELFIGPPAQ